MSQPGHTHAITAPIVFDGDVFLREHCIILRDDAILGVQPLHQRPKDIPLETFPSGTIAPGFIDLQVNGGGGMLFNNAPTQESLEQMLSAHRSCGTTSIMPTVISDDLAVQQQALEAVQAFRAKGSEGVLGIHMEGPFLNPEKCGVHKQAALRKPLQEDITWLMNSAKDTPIILTVAPEIVTPAQIQQLTSAGIVVCAGHTNASYEDMAAAVASGLQGVTHLFNAMSSIQARKPGAVGAALDIDTLWAGIIADGHHVHDAGIRLAARSKPAGKLILVSDAMATVGSTQETFTLYGADVRSSGTRLTNGDGKLAGSAIALIDAVAHIHQNVGLPLDEALRMASSYPATVLHRHNTLGRIQKKYRADLIHFDENFNVHRTWRAGAVQLHSHQTSLSCSSK